MKIWKYNKYCRRSKL